MFEIFLGLSKILIYDNSFTCYIGKLLLHMFQHSLFLRITTLLSWLKSTLLLKIKCFDTTIYMKTQCLQTNEAQHYCRKERCFEKQGEEEKG